jgi:hypothetical protein
LTSDCETNTMPDSESVNAQMRTMRKTFSVQRSEFAFCLLKFDSAMLAPRENQN